MRLLSVLTPVLRHNKGPTRLYSRPRPSVAGSPRASERSRAFAGTSSRLSDDRNDPSDASSPSSTSAHPPPPDEEDPVKTFASLPSTERDLLLLTKMERVEDELERTHRLLGYFVSGCVGVFVGNAVGTVSGEIKSWKALEQDWRERQEGDEQLAAERRRQQEEWEEWKDAVKARGWSAVVVQSSPAVSLT